MSSGQSRIERIKMEALTLGRHRNGADTGHRFGRWETLTRDKKRQPVSCVATCTRCGMKVFMSTIKSDRHGPGSVPGDQIWGPATKRKCTNANQPEPEEKETFMHLPLSVQRAYRASTRAKITKITRQPGRSGTRATYLSSETHSTGPTGLRNSYSWQNASTDTYRVSLPSRTDTWVHRGGSWRRKDKPKKEPTMDERMENLRMSIFEPVRVTSLTSRWPSTGRHTSLGRKR